MTVQRFSQVENRRAIIDRRKVADAIAALMDGSKLRDEVCRLLADAQTAGRAEIARRLQAEPGRGRIAAASYAWLSDQIVRLIHDFVTTRLYPLGNPTDAERVSLVALGGYGRGEMAPFSDLDLMFLTPTRRSGWCEQVIESMLYLLWDLKFKVGQSSRSPTELINLAREDVTVRTAMLEARWVWGDEALYALAAARFREEIVDGTARQFVAAKLEEREARHKRMGDTRYVVEPNVKDGKGGLRDLHTLYWIGKYMFGVKEPSDLVGVGLLTAREFRQFERAERFLWAVRCHLHLATGRPEDRLSFDNQRRIAAAMNYADRPGKSAVERFMHFYFLNAKTVGDLTGVFLAQLDEQVARKGRRFTLPALTRIPALRRRPWAMAGFTLDRGRLAIPRETFFSEDPVRLVELFAIATRDQLEIHPAAIRSAARDAKLIDASVRSDARANALFLEVLTDKRAPDMVLRWMNEAGVFGRFVPDFGRVVAQMQFDMYHHFTVDEHSIRAIGELAAIERGEKSKELPVSTAIFRQIDSRRLLYVAVLLHDIAKGRHGDHSLLGEEVARKLCPRLGLTPAEVDTVAWLVRHHLLMSNTAFKRDLADPQTIRDFVDQVQSPERLRLLQLLTVVDIRAVGPGVWTEWKRQLLVNLFEAAEEVLRLGHKRRGRVDRIAARQAEVAEALGLDEKQMRAHAQRFADSYWLAEPTDSLIANTRQVLAAGDDRAHESVVATDDPSRGATRISLFAPDKPGLFYRTCAALAAAGANIIDARIHTTRDGMALDNLLVQDARGEPYQEARSRNRLVKMVNQAIAGELPDLPVDLDSLTRRRAAFIVPPMVLVADGASRRTTVVEVQARDRPALLAHLSGAILQAGHTIHSAHIATYGERAVDVFYLTRSDGGKLTEKDGEDLRKRLLAAAEDDGDSARAA